MTLLPRNDKGWGHVAVGDRVTSEGRHGAGQPVVTGRLQEIGKFGAAYVQTPDGLRQRSIRNLRKVT